MTFCRADAAQPQKTIFRTLFFTFRFLTMPTKHTPGPWKYQRATKTIRSGKENYWIATMDSWDGAVNNEANAKLIAAAPEMKARLEQVLPYLYKMIADGHEDTAIPVSLVIKRIEETLSEL